MSALSLRWRVCTVLAVYAALGAGGITAGVPERVEATLSCASPLARITVREAGATLRIDPGLALRTPVLLEVEEQGQPIEIESAAASRTIAVPPRLGVIALHASGAFELRLRLPPGRPVATAAARLECDAERATRAWAWWGGASALSAILTQGVGSTSLADVTPRLEALEMGAYDARSHAWAAHLRAQALLTSANARDAAASFLQAESAWRELGDEPRATAARVAAVEDMNRVGAYGQVLELASAPIAPGKADYYGVRLHNARCLALRYLGRLDEAGECYSITTRRLLELGEPLELAVTSLDFGTIELDRGNLDSAVDLFQRSLALAAGPKVDDERGRAEFYLADAAVRAGRPADAVAHLRRAMAHFERSGSGRWLGSSLLRLGGILSELGATADARIAVEQGLRHFDEKHAPARIAAGRLALARIALRGARPSEALADADRARALYVALSMPIEVAAADDLRLRILVESSDWRTARTLALDIERGGSVSSTSKITLADLELGSGAMSAAADRLADVDVATLTLSDRWRFQRSRARILRAQGAQDAALESLRRASDEWWHFARRTRSPLLRERLEAFAAGLSALAVDILVETAARGDFEGRAVGLDEALAWLSVSIASEADPQPQTVADHRALDRQIAASLFPALGNKPSLRSDMQRALLEALNFSSARGAGTGETHVPRVVPADLRALLTGNDLAWVVLDGERHVLVVRVSADGEFIHLVSDRAGLRRDIDALNVLVRTPTARTVDIRDAARRVAERLSIRGESVPATGRVFVLPTGDLADIPWPVVLDPIDPPTDRVITLLVPRTQTGSALIPPPAAIEVYVASQRGNGMLAPLESAQREAEQIRRAMPAALVDIHAAATREQVLGGLARPDAWLHIAAHGTHVPGRIGGAGIWLDSAQDGTAAAYLSWLEILDRGTAAPVIVLNACDLAGDDQGEAGFIGFSTALLRSGTQHVVAAHWPVSDTASATWVAAFYREAARRDATLAGAVAAARAALHGSRAFRHPYYWAGLSHLQALVPRDAAAATR